MVAQKFAVNLLQSSKTAEFLPYIASGDGSRTLKNIVVTRLNELQRLIALPGVPDSRVIDAEPTVRHTQGGAEQEFVGN